MGERWALLVVRELQHGPLRYTDLLERLEGCSTNILATRLRELEAQGIVGKERLPPPAAVTVYTLTPAGAALRPVLRELAWWGLGLLGAPPADFAFDDEGLARALRTALPDELDATLEFRVAGGLAHVGPDGVATGASPDADVVIATDAAGLFRLFVERDSSAAVVTRDPDALDRLVTRLPRVLGVPVA